MGAGTSKTGLVTSNKISRQRLLEMTQQPRVFIDEVFNAMVTKLTPKDLLALSNPSECKKAIFVMKDAIDATFRKLRIRPQKDKSSGILYYSLIDELVPQGDSKSVGFRLGSSTVSSAPPLAGSTNKFSVDAEEYYGHCLDLAYFYIRIFQIFGALAITVADNSKAGSTSSMGYVKGPERGIVGALPTPLKKTWSLWGGSLTREQFIEPFSDRFLSAQTSTKIRDAIRLTANQYLPFATYVISPETKQSVREISILYMFERFNTMRLRISMNSSLSSITTIVLEFIIDSENKLVGSIRYKPIYSYGESKSVGYELSSISLKRKNANPVLLPNSSNYSRSFNFVKDGDQYVSKDKATELNGKTMDELFNFYFTAVVDSLNSSRPISELVGEPAKGSVSYSTPSGYVPSSSYTPSSSMFSPGGLALGRQTFGTSTNPLDTDYIKQFLRTDMPRQTSYCVSRALQLLDINPLSSSKKAMSHICNPKFTADKPILPDPKASLAKSPGLQSLEHLYYSLPQLKKSGSTWTYDIKTVDPEYKQFLNDLRKELMGATDPIPDGKTMKDLGMRDTGCTVTTGTSGDIELGEAKIKSVLPYVQQLYGIQQVQTAKVYQFITTYLIVKKTGSDGSKQYYIHPSIIQNIPNLEVVAKKARELIKAYYIGCEQTYQKGVAAVKA
jgi:hypothetical protein